LGAANRKPGICERLPDVAVGVDPQRLFALIKRAHKCRIGAKVLCEQKLEAVAQLHVEQKVGISLSYSTNLRHHFDKRAVVYHGTDAQDAIGNGVSQWKRMGIGANCALSAMQSLGNNVHFNVLGMRYVVHVATGAYVYDDGVWMLT
jgi:hypothetical protein